MSKEQEFENNARQALDSAQVTADVRIRAHWLKLADYWLELAEAEKIESAVGAGMTVKQTRGDAETG